MKVWIVATYKVNELKRLYTNLQNQDFNYYNPKIRIKNHNHTIKKEPMFPGYIFINSDISNYYKIKYTKGISSIIRFNNNIAIMSNDEIDELKRIQEKSFQNPVSPKIIIGQETVISDGPLKGLFVTIASMPIKNRVNVFIHMLGSKRRITASLSEIKL